MPPQQDVTLTHTDLLTLQLLHTSEHSLPKSYPLRFQTQLKRNVLPEVLSCCPWLKAAPSGSCNPLRTLQKGRCPHRCPPGIWAQCGLTWTEADCTYLPGAKEAKMPTGHWPQWSSLATPHLRGAGRLSLYPHWQRGSWQGLWLGAPWSQLPRHKHPSGSPFQDLGYR